MRHLIILLLTLTAAVCLQAASSPEEEIRDVVKTYLEAREKRDPKLLATVFTSDVDQLVSSGEWRKGHSSLVEGTLASSARETGKRTVEIETVRLLSKEIAIADGRYTISGDNTQARRMWSTFVMKREGGKWKIAAIRNMLPTGNR